MKKIVLIFSMLLIFLSVTYYIVKTTNNNNDYTSGNMSDYLEYIEKVPLKGECVPDASTARNIAEALLYAKYGNKIKNNRPFKVMYDDKNKVWIVEGNLKQPLIGGVKYGGVPYIIIQKSDGKVIGMWHTK